MPFSTITRMLKTLNAATKYSVNEAILSGRFAALAKARMQPAPSDPLIAVVQIPDVGFYAILGETVSGLRTRQPLRVQQIFTQALRHGAAQSLRHFFRARLDFNYFSRRKWETLYGQFCDSVAYRSSEWASPLQAALQWLQAWRIWRSLHDKESLAALSWDGIKMGDLVIDSYLRLRPTPFILLDDPYLLVVIRQALKDIHKAYAYFRRERPAAVLSIYSTYLQHGIPARVALACNIKVLTFGNLQEFCTPLSVDHLPHTKDSTRYLTDFNNMADHPEKISLARQAMEARLSGHPDAATAYMKKSAYAATTQNIPDVSGAAVIFLHNFYDSVHGYHWTLFHDFWEWACTTIELLRSNGHDVWVKPHPNQDAESAKVAESLRKKYPDAKFIDSSVTNRQLADAGMTCAITLYGSVAPEVAFMGIPSISSGDSPHASFDAFHLARTRSEYAALLSNLPRRGPQAEKLKFQACAYYYMHNMHHDEHGALLRDRFAAVWVYLLGSNSTICFDEKKVTDVLTSLTNNPAFQYFSDTLLYANRS